MPRSSPRRLDVRDRELIGGVERLQVTLHDADPTWRDVFEEHRRRLRQALADRAVLIEHIGSTSVAGLAAKPIVDIVVAVADIAAEEDYLPALVAAGYVLRVREPGHRLVRTPERDVHVHVYAAGDAAVEAYLLFRDRLRADAADRSLYESTKRALLEREWDDMNAYADAKTAVIRGILERARAQRDSERGEDGP